MLYGHYSFEKLVESVQEDRMREALQDARMAEVRRSAGSNKAVKAYRAVLNLPLRLSLNRS